MKYLIDKKMSSVNSRKIAIRLYRQIRIVHTEAIVFCRAKGRFANITIIDENEQLSTRHSLKELETLLCEDSFIRCHRCILVNMQYVKGYDPGRNELILVNDVSLKVSKLKANLIRQYIGKHNK
jgi:DNA-binding LytR/AlgR family response regulator